MVIWNYTWHQVEKKLSSYSFSLIALSATAPSTGRIATELPPETCTLVSNFLHKVITRAYSGNARTNDAPFEMATLRSSIAASRSGWKGCCDKGNQRCNKRRTIEEHIRYHATRRFFFPFGLSTDLLILRFPEFSFPSDISAMGVPFEPVEYECEPSLSPSL